jgi:hypothetical protein
MNGKTAPIAAEVAPANTGLSTEFLRRRWRLGQSGNWAGRPRSRLEFLARERTLDGKALVEFWTRVFEGKEPGSAGAKGLRWRAWASQRLAERGWGKAPLIVESSSARLEEIRVTYQQLASGLSAAQKMALADVVATLQQRQRDALGARTAETVAASLAGPRKIQK